MRRSIRTAFVSFVFATGIGLTGLAYAQDAAPARKPPPGFQPVKGAPSTENVDANKLVVAAYGAILVGFLGYVVMVSRKQAEIAQQMQELAARVGNQDS